MPKPNVPRRELVGVIKEALSAAIDLTYATTVSRYGNLEAGLSLEWAALNAIAVAQVKMDDVLDRLYADA